MNKKKMWIAALLGYLFGVADGLTFAHFYGKRVLAYFSQKRAERVS